MKKPLIQPSHRGLLHEKLGVPQGAPIPAKKVAAAKNRAKKDGDVTLEREAVFAQNFGGKK